MQPTLFDGDRVLVTKMAKKDIHRGDIMIFTHNGIPYIKRCVGLPGDTIRIIDQLVYVNGVLYEFPFNKKVRKKLPEERLHQPSEYDFDIHDR